MALKGIDVSEWQKAINWNKVKKDGIQFCILRQGYKNTIDSYFLEYASKAKQAGIPIHGVYHFCYSLNEQDVIKQAKTCISHVQKAGLDKNTIIFFDFEYDTVDKAKEKGIILGKNQCIAFTKTFCDYILSQGYRTGIYSNDDYYQRMYDKETIYKYNIFWLADYRKTNQPKYKCTYRQYSSKGKVNGINGDVDMNQYYQEEILSDNSSFNNTQKETIKMDFSKYYGKISNSGSDERGKASGGKAGDQGTEWTIRSWYNRPWNCVLRYPDRKVGDLIAELGIEAANNNLIGYDQSQRNTYWEHLKASNYRPSQITIACEADCSKGVIDNTRAVGYLLNIPALQNINATYTGNMRSGFKAAGFQVLTASKYLNGFDYLMPGDILLNDVHHTATNLGIGKKSGYINNSSSSPTTTTVGKNITTTKTSEIQKMLNKVGNYGLKIDNDFGPATTKAVKDFQSKNGLEVDGIVGNQTLNKLKAATAELASTSTTTKGYNKTPKTTGTVTVNALYVRSGPGSNYEPLKSIPIIYYTNRVDICDETISEKTGEKWYYIRIKGTTYGFCAAKYIKKD